MNATEAKTLLAEHPSAVVRLNPNAEHTDPPQSHLTVWLDEDGNLVHAHPTSPELGPCKAPADGRYYRAD